MSLYSVVFPITKNYGFYGVKDNKLVTGDNLNSLVKFFNRERAESIAEGNRLDCNINNWNLYDWYANNQCIEQRNTFHLERALERKGVKSYKFPIFFGSGNMASLLNQLLFFDSFKEKKINNGYEITKFNFNPETGLRFIAKVYRSDLLEGKHGHIAEYLLVTSKENADRHIEIGRELTYLINSLEFPDSDVILFSSKEFECFWDREAPLNAENACEVKTFNGDGLYGIKQKQLVVKNFALGRIRRLAMVTHENFTTISKVRDIETLNENRTLESFYACLNNFTKLIVHHCRENQLTGGFVETFRHTYDRFMIIRDENHFWCYLFDIDSTNFCGGLKFPDSLSAIRWPFESRCPVFDRNKITNIQRYSFEDPYDSTRVLHHVEGNCLLVVRRNSELDLAPNFKYKISMEDPIFLLIEEILLQFYYAEDLNYYEAPDHN